MLFVTSLSIFSYLYISLETMVYWLNYTALLTEPYILHLAAVLRYMKRMSLEESPGGYSTLSWVRMCGPKFRPPPYKKTREDANLLPI